MKPKIYLDNNATTALDPRVLEAVVLDLKTYYGNPSSVHGFGQASRNRLIKSRHLIAQAFQVKPSEVIFTSGATEALNMVLKGICGGSNSGAHIVTSSVEHAAVYGTCKSLEEQGAQVSYLEPGLWGAVTAEAVRQAIRPHTRLIALMAVNNETGVKTDVEAIASIAEEKQIPFLVDAVAWLGKEAFIIPRGVSAICFSGHKIHAPKGIGVAIIRSHVKLQPLIIGGEQEFGRRGGTENMSGIIGFAEAIRLMQEELIPAIERMELLRDKLEQRLLSELPNVVVNGQGPRIGNTSNLSFLGIEGEALLTALDMEGIAVSHGSACASGALEPSRILLNMGIPMEQARTAIRFSLSRFTTEEEIHRCAEVVVRSVNRLRG